MSALEIAATSLEALFETENLLGLESTLQSLIGRNYPFNFWEQISRRLSAKFDFITFADAQTAQWLCLTYFMGRHPQAILDCVVLHPSSENLVALSAWAYASLEQHTSTIAIRAKNPAPKSPLFANLWHWAAGVSGAQTQQTNWKEEFEKAKVGLEGVLLGRLLLDLGNSYVDNADLPQARVYWSQALGLFGHDAFHAARTSYNLGISLSKEDLGLAEGYLLQAVSLGSTKAGAPFLARSLVGLASVRRALGEWKRAHYAYESATKAKGDSDDLQQAYWGMGQCQRLMGNLELAAQYFESAMAVHKPNDWLRVSLAATYAQMGAAQEVQNCMQDYVPKRPHESFLWQVVSARLLQLSGQKLQAVSALQKIDLKLRWATEEQHCFPQLFELIGQAQTQQPVTEVKVKAKGALELSINDRPVHLKSNGKAAEILVFILEKENRVSLEQLCAALYPDSDLPRAKKSVWEHIDQLRHILGWRESIGNQDSAVFLGKDALWEYDFFGSAGPREVFFEGVYSNWVEEIRQGVS